MSTGLECELRAPTPGAWFYILEHWDAPKQAWDWHDYATAYGPFPSQAAALAHLHTTQANPGGYSCVPYASHLTMPASAVLERLIAEATAPTPRRNPW